jgi:4-amino-4-deoxy-L-arabinose transferase-like glycosyltransferase
MPAELMRRPWLAAVALVLVAGALAGRLAYVDHTPGYQLIHDARDYDVHARSIAQGEGYSRMIAYGRPTAFRPPGFPYFLGGVYWVAGVERAPTADRVQTGRIAQAFVGTAVVALIGVLAGQLFGAVAALLALGLAAIYVPLIVVGGSVMSEPLFDLCMLASLVAAVAHRRSRHRYRWALLAGLFAGLAILTRANAVILLVPLAVAVWDGRPWRSRRALGPPAALVAIAILAVVPWTIRNAEDLHAFVPVSTQLGSALAGTYNDAARADTQNPASWRSLKHVPDYAYLFDRVREIPEAELDKKLRSAAEDYMLDHPLYVAEVGWWNTRRMVDLGGLDHARATAATISISRTWADRSIVCFWIFAVLAVLGAATRRAREAPLFVWAVPLLMYLSVVFLVVETPRYRTAIDPFVILLAALAVCALATRAHRALAPRLRRSGARSPLGATRQPTARYSSSAGLPRRMPST